MHQFLDIVRDSGMMRKGVIALKCRQTNRGISPSPSHIEADEPSPAGSGGVSLESSNR